MPGSNADNWPVSEDEQAGQPGQAGQAGQAAQAGQAGSVPSVEQPPFIPAQPQQPPFASGQEQYPQPGYPQSGYPQPGYPQPGYPQAQPGYAGGFPPQDVLAAGTMLPRRRKVMPIVLSVVAVVAVVAAGGAFAAYRMLASTGGQPDALVPASTVAYTKVDLDPSASTKISAWQFEQHFPNAPKVTSADQLKDAVLQAAFKQSIDYNADIKPWLGDRVAGAIFLDANSTLQPIAILQVKDEAKAKAALQKLTNGAAANAVDDTFSNPVAFAISNGYAILGATQAVVDDALAQAKKGDIDTNSTYQHDVGTVGGNQVVTVWADYGSLVKAELDQAGNGAAASLGMLGLSSDTYKGRLAMGLTISDNAVTIQGRELGFSDTFQTQPGTAGQTLGELRSSTVAAFAVSNPESYLKALMAQVSSSPLIAQGLQGELDQASLQLGIKVPDDIYNLVGSEFVVGLDSAPDAANPDATALLTFLTKPDDEARALATAQKLADLASQLGVSLKVSTDTHLVVTNDPTPGTGKLSDTADYKAAMSGMPSKVSMAGYVALGSFLAQQPTAPADAKQLGGLGFYLGTDSTSPVFTMRLTVK